MSLRRDEGRTHFADDATLARMAALGAALRDLVATIELHTDCMSNEIDRAALEPWLEKAEAVLGEAAGRSAEVIVWVTADDELPDDDTTVLLDTGNHDTFPGFRDAGLWRWSDATPVEAPVLRWAQMPAGSGRPEC